jgi:hypothetical protein
MTNLEAALYYLNHFQFSVIPVKQDKKPLIPWQEYQTRRPTQDEVNGWWLKYPQANVGIVTGKVSGVVVLDVDDPSQDISTLIPDSLIAPTCQTPRGGHHIYFKAPDEPIGNATGIIPHVDFRGDGGFVVTAPSTNGTGKEYAWLVDPSSISFPILPNSIKSLIKNNNAFKGGYRGGPQDDNCDNIRHGGQVVTLSLDMGMRDESLFNISN